MNLIECTLLVQSIAILYFAYRMGNLERKVFSIIEMTNAFLRAASESVKPAEQRNKKPEPVEEKVVVRDTSRKFTEQRRKNHAEAMRKYRERNRALRDISQKAQDSEKN